MDIEKIENKIKELGQQILELNEDLEELKKEEKEKKEIKRWRAKKCDYYFYIDDWLDLNGDQEGNSTLDNRRYESGNYFQTREQGKKQIEKLKIYMQLKDLALRLNNGEKIDWNNSNQSKYYIFMNYNFKSIGQACANSCKDLGQIYCLSENFLNIALEEIGKENLKFLFGVENEM